MSAPSTPVRNHRAAFLGTVLSPHTAHAMSRLTKATLEPSPELLEQFVEKPPSSLQAVRNKLSIQMQNDKADYESAQEHVWDQKKKRTTWTEKKDMYLQKIDECDAELFRIEEDIDHHNNIKESKLKDYDTDGMMVQTTEFLLDKRVPKKYRFMPIPAIREERNLQHQGKIPDNLEELKKIIYRLYNLDLELNPDFEGTNPNETNGFKGFLHTGNGSKDELKARIIQYLKIPLAPTAPSAVYEEAQLVPRLPLPPAAMDRATQQEQLAEMIRVQQEQLATLQARLLALDAPAAHQHQPPAAHQHQPPAAHQHQPPAAHHPAGDDDNGSKPSTKKRQRCSAEPA